MNRRIFFVLVAALIIMGRSDRSTRTRIERLAEPITFDNALAAHRNREDGYRATMQDERGIVLCNETRNERYGTWRPSTLAPDGPVLYIDSGVVPEDLDPTWTAQDEQTAWHAMTGSPVDEQLDSELVRDDTPDYCQLSLGVGISLSSAHEQDPETSDFYINVGTRFDAWLGPRLFDHDNDEWLETGVQIDTEYLPAQPAAYALDRPRTLVNSLVLGDVAAAVTCVTILFRFLFGTPLRPVRIGARTKVVR